MAAAMSRWSRDKGARIEREIVAAHAGLGIKGERVPLSGAARYRGNGADVDLYVFGPDAAPIVCEVKARASGEGFATLERWLGDADALFLRRDRADPLVVLPWQTWFRLVPSMASGRTVAQSVAEAYQRPGPASCASTAATGDCEATTLDELIAAPQATHGDFADTASIAQALKAVFATAGADRFGPAQRESLDQIAVKLARICAGAPASAEHWRDLAGYAWLAGRESRGW
jgi:Holliday junction resolvase